MKCLKKLLTALVVFLLIISISCAHAAAYVFKTDKDNVSFLLCGIDEEAGNADTIIILNSSQGEKSVRLLHIPRDTMIIYGGRRTKINSVFSLSRAKGLSDSDSLAVFRRYIESFTGLPFDASFLLTTVSFVNIVDAIGGVDIISEKPIVIKRSDSTLLKLNVGNNKLSGKDALLFVRHRQSYIDADLGRINAQKLFISSFINKLESLDISSYLSLIKAVSDSVITDAGVSSLPALLQCFNLFKEQSISFFTLPGDSVCLDGVWYYKLRYDEVISLLKKLGSNTALGNGALQ